MSPIERTGTYWLVATTPDRLSAQLRIDHLMAQPARIAWWIVEQDAKMLMRALRVKGMDPDDAAGIEWKVVRVRLVYAGPE